MPALDNWTEVPQDVIQKIYEKHGGSTTWEKEVDEYFTSRLSSPEAWNAIACLNEVPTKDIRPGQLVRFRCMVQDQLGPEMYGAAALVKNSASGTEKTVTGKFKDELSLGVTEEILNWNSTESRQCFYCVPVPGETPWVKQNFRLKSGEHTTQSRNFAPVGKKRPLDEEDSCEMMDSCDVKRPCPPNGAPSATENGNMDKILNFPLPSSDPVGCIVKMYKEEELPLNEVMEVVGIVSFNTPGVSAEGDDKEEFHPPSSIIPRIHSIIGNKWIHNNPNLTTHLNPKWEQESATVAATAAAMRDELHGLLTEFFAGDSLAADYLLCYLVSRVYIRRDALALGKLSLNLSNIPPASGAQESYGLSMYNLLERLVTKSHYLPMSLQNMNTLKMIPKKDYQENRLIAGCLQLSPNSHLVLDETAMTEGQLVAEGIKNVTALGNIATWQKIEYDFNYHQVEFHTDIPVLILSERRSMIATDVHLPLRLNEAENNHAAIMERLEANSELLASMRNYLTVVRLLPCSLDDTMQEAVQNDFIQSRAPGHANPMSTEDFHLLLVLSRLLALTYGKSDLSESLWQRTKTMEVERKSRLTSAR